MALRLVLVTSLAVACAAVAVYNPPHAGEALDAIEKALARVVQSPHLSKHQFDEATNVSSDVEKIVQELESPEGKQLSTQARAAKVTFAIDELQGLQTEWQKAAADTVASHKADLMKQLQEKETELNKDKNMLKVLNLEKQLAEKKLALQKLIDIKQEKDMGASQQEAAAQQEMVANVLNMAKALQTSKSANSSMTNAAHHVADGKPNMLKTVLTYLESRERNVTDSIARLDAVEIQREEKLKNATERTVPVNGSADAITKGRSLLHVLLKKEHHNYEKSKATLKNELKELGGAVAAIKTGDIAGLSKIMNDMQGDMKALEAKSHKFLY